MKHKSFLLPIFLIMAFMFQQVRVEAKNFSDTKVVFPLLTGSDLTGTVNVTFYRLNQTGSLYLNPVTGLPEPCTPKNSGFFNDHYGCTEYDGQGEQWAYPYPANPYNVPVETDYLLDVLSHEMDPHLFYDPDSVGPDLAQTLPAEQAQAIASRTFAYNKEPLTNFGDSNGTLYKATQADIPFSFEKYIANPLPLNEPNNPVLPCQSTNLVQIQKYVCNAVTSTQGVVLSVNGSVIDSEFGNDMENQTANGNTNDIHYLEDVQEPISTTCDVGIVGNGWGMSQNGANRWAKGNQCATVESGNQPWPVKWNDYRQILAHYYTGIDIMGSGGKIAPDNRWNLLNYTGLSARLYPFIYPF